LEAGLIFVGDRPAPQWLQLSQGKKRGRITFSAAATPVW
jgi:hypothetical protein